jgi:glycosyltransferase involved in cell wall biosynthesis
MKIIVFVEDFGATGVVRNAIAIAGRLAEVGHDVTLLAAKPDGVLRSSAPDAVVTASLNELGGRGSRKALMRRSFGRFRKFMTRDKPDIVISSGNHGHLLVLGGTHFLPCRTIIRISNDLDHRISDQEAGAWASLTRKLKFRTILALADRVVLVSDRLLDQVRTLDPALGRKAVIIPNGVDVEAVREQSKSQLAESSLFDSPAPVVIAMGRLVPQKNFATLLHAIAIARKTGDVRLVVIGTGPLQATLLLVAERLGIADAVRFINPVPNPFPIMKKAALMILPSWWEGSSNVLLEAVACGIPVMASRTAGNAADILDDGRYGLLVDPGNAEEMAAAILKQIGPDAVLPGDRAYAFDRKVTLTAYADLVAGMTSR